MPIEADVAARSLVHESRRRCHQIVWSLFRLDGGSLESKRKVADEFHVFKMKQRRPQGR